MTYKNAEQIDAYVKVKSSFSDFAVFEGNGKARAEEKRKFIEGRIYAPRYAYPALDQLYDIGHQGNQLLDKKRDIYEAVLELEANKNSGILSPVEHELYADFHESRLKKIMLVEAAKRMRRAGLSSEQVVARREFMALNREIYGDMDEPAFLNIMATEQQRVKDVAPANKLAQSVKRYLETYFNGHHYAGKETPLLDDATLGRLKDVILERYGNTLGVVPDTDDEAYYDADQCRDIMQKALEAGGLADKGWAVELDAQKSNPVTSIDSKKISLPTDTRRTAAQLRRLIIHEQEVHARRGQNGAETGIVLLEKGTADYADVEEGLGVLLECVVAGDFDNQSFYRARDRYITAGLALGLDGAPKDASATYNLIWRIIALRLSTDGVITEANEHEAKKLAMQHTENAFRGTNFVMPGIIYTKLKVYYEGLVKNASYFLKHVDDLEGALDRASHGKYNHTDDQETAHIEQLLAKNAGH